MRTGILAIVIAAVLTGSTFLASAAEPGDKMVQLAKAPKGFAMVDETAWAPMMEEPAGYLERAREAFMKKDFKASTADMRKSAALVHLEASRAIGEDEKALVRAENDISQLIVDIDQGSVKDEKAFDRTMAAAFQALAAHYYALANDALASDNRGMTAFDMRASAAFLERSLKTLGMKNEEQAIKTIEGVRRMANALLDGAAWAPDDVGNAVTQLGEEVGKLSSKLPAGK